MHAVDLARGEREGHGREGQATVVGVEAVQVERGGVEGIEEARVAVQEPGTPRSVVGQGLEAGRGQHHALQEVLPAVDGSRLLDDGRQVASLRGRDALVPAGDLQALEEDLQHGRGRGVQVDRAPRERAHGGAPSVEAVLERLVQDERPAARAAHDDAELVHLPVGDPDGRPLGEPAVLGDADRVRLEGRDPAEQAGRALPGPAGRDVPVHRPELAHARAQGRVDAALQGEVVELRQLLEGVEPAQPRSRGRDPPQGQGVGALVDGVIPDPVLDRRERTIGRPLAVVVLERAHPAGQSGQAAVRAARLARPADPLPAEDQDPRVREGGQVVHGHHVPSRRLDRAREASPEASQVPDDERARAVEVDAPGLVPNVEVPHGPAGVVRIEELLRERARHAELVGAVGPGRLVEGRVGPGEVGPRVPGGRGEAQAGLRSVRGLGASGGGVARGREERRRQHEEREQHHQHRDQHEAAAAPLEMARAHPSTVP